MQEVVQEGEAFRPKPDREGEEKCEAGAVAEEVQFIEGAGTRLVAVKTVGFGAGGLVEQLFGEDVLSDEDKGAAKGAKYAEEVAGKLNRAGEDNAQR